MNTSDRDQLALCQDELRRMEEEIALLRNASLTFGELADRLNHQVQTLRARLRAGDEAEARIEPSRHA
jgi:hypothetical protein